MVFYFYLIMKFKNLILPTLALACALPAGAVKAINKFVPVTQPDGTVVQIKKCGDEFSHYLVSTDGALLAEVQGAYYFGKLDNAGRVASTGVLAADPSRRTAAQKAAVTMVDDKVESRMLSARSSSRRAIAQDGMGRFTSNFPRKGDINGLVILVEYKDVPFTLTDAHEYFSGLLNTDGFSEYNATGCAAEYFRSNSGNQFRPVFDVFGPVKLPQNRSYYGANDFYGNDKAPEDMVIHAIRELDEEVDFSRYDMDGDGYLDNVFIIYAGQGEASYGSASTVWPHSWELSSAGKSFKVDGVTVDTYGCTNEWEQNRPDGVGTFIHEFSHVMGLPDLYSTGSQNLACTPGEWSVLDYGPYNNDGCTPPNYSTYERLAMGWIDPQIIDGPVSVELQNLADVNKACIIQTPKNTEYYLFENRQQTGWDKYLPGHGMLIWHVDFVQSVFDANQVNNLASHQYVEMKKASGVTNATNASAWAGWSWPGTNKKTSFTDDTNPSMKTWTGKRLNLPITNITESDGLITFDVAGGQVYVEAPVATVPVNGGEDWFEATWNPVENATDYFLTVTRKVAGGEEEVFTNNMGNGTTLSLPEGWTSTTTDVYSTNTNYGLAAPSYKMNAEGVSMTSPVFEANVMKIAFWHKGMQAVGSTLEITGVDAAGQKIEIATITPNKSSSKSETITEIPSGIRQVIFTYHKVGGNMAIDDIEITTGGSTSSVLEGYDHVSTGGDTKFRVNHQKEEGVVYSYFVEATDGEHISKASAPVEVPDTLGSGVAQTVASDIFNISGREVSAYDEVEITDLSGRTLFRGTGRYTLPAAGVYVIRHQEKASKLMVR